MVFDQRFAIGHPFNLAIAGFGHDLLEIQKMREALANLPERLQPVMQLYFAEELNLAEIAATLDVSVPRVHQLKAQARDRLRAELRAMVDFV